MEQYINLYNPPAIFLNASQFAVRMMFTPLHYTDEQNTITW